MLRKILLWFLLLVMLPLYADDQPLTLDFTDAPVTDILQTIAQLSGHNLVLGGNVNGVMSLHVNKMNWPAALQMVLTAQNLSINNMDADTWYIADSNVIANQVRAQTEVDKTLSDAGPVQMAFFKVHYANPVNLFNLIRNNHALLSARGQISLDQRTSTLVASDTQAHLQLIQQLLQTLDVPVASIEIDSRIVVVNKSALNALGVTLNNASTPNAAQVLGSVNNSTNINLPVINPAGALGFSLGNIGGQQLDLQLQALEAEGDGKVVSAPELTVSDNQEAYIEQGSEVPFRTATSSGATQIEFKKAVLGLQVTPQIMEDGSINLKLQINKDAVTNQDGANNTTPIISTSQVSTNVRVGNGQTLVLGGIYNEDKSTSVRQVPVLGGIPGLGWLFKSQDISDQYTDLLVFITPKILN